MRWGTDIMQVIHLCDYICNYICIHYMHTQPHSHTYNLSGGKHYERKVKGQRKFF